MQMDNFENIRLPWPGWKIVKDLGGGTYGRVYEIERTISGIQEKAALKIVSRPKNKDEIESYYNEGYSKADLIASYESEIQNYVQEYKLMKELQGESNIVSCDDFTLVPHEDGIGGDIFIRMELLTSLQQILRERSLSEQEIIKLGKDISHALVLCESKNIIHRDIKPANIMVSQFGNYKLGDFGVSKIMDHETYATAMGTPDYQAPEVVHMEKYGQTADIYSLGITLYWLLNNRRMPFIDANQQITLVVKNEAMDRRYRGEKLPAPKNGSAKLKKIVLKACEYQPENRYLSAQEMYDALDALENGKILLDPVPVENPESIGETGEISMDPVTVEELGSTGNQTGGNSWSGNGGTIGSPGSTKKPDQPTGGEQEEPKTAGPWSGGKKDQITEEKEFDYFWENYGLKYRTLKDVHEFDGNKWYVPRMFFGLIVGIASGLLAVVLNVCFIIGFIWGLYTVFSIDSWQVGKWISYAKTIIPDFDQKIAQDKEFAKWVYKYQTYGKRKMRKYIKNLNPEAGKEIETSM